MIPIALISAVATLMGVAAASCGASQEAVMPRGGEVAADTAPEEENAAKPSDSTERAVSNSAESMQTVDDGASDVEPSTPADLLEPVEMGQRCIVEQEREIGTERVLRNGSSIRAAVSGDTLLVGYRMNQKQIRFATLNTDGSTMGNATVLEVSDVSSLRHIETIGPYFVAIAVGMCPKEPVECFYTQLFSADGKPVGDLDIRRQKKIGNSSLISRSDNELQLEYRREKCGQAFYSLRLSERGTLTWSLLKDMCDRSHTDTRQGKTEHWVAMYLSPFLVAANENFWVGITNVDGYTRTSVGGNASIALVGEGSDAVPVPWMAGEPWKVKALGENVAVIFENGNPRFATMTQGGKLIGKPIVLHRDTPIPEPWTDTVEGSLARRGNETVFVRRNAAGYEIGEPTVLENISAPSRRDAVVRLGNRFVVLHHRQTDKETATAFFLNCAAEKRGRQSAYNLFRHGRNL